MAFRIDIEKTKTSFEIIKIIITSVAVIVAGIWTYWLYIQDRTTYPHAELTHNVTHVKLRDDAVLLRVEVTVKNNGNSLLVAPERHSWVQQVLPLSPRNTAGKQAIAEIDKSLNKKFDKEHFSWPLLSKASISDEYDADDENSRGEASIEIESGESDTYDIEFVVSAKVEVVRIYTWLGNSQKDAAIGWRYASLYDLREPLSELKKEEE